MRPGERRNDRRGDGKAVGRAGGQEDLAESLGYAIKRRLLGPPLVNEQLGEERLSKPLALGVLAPTASPRRPTAPRRS